DADVRVEPLRPLAGRRLAVLADVARLLLGTVRCAAARRHGGRPAAAQARLPLARRRRHGGGAAEAAPAVATAAADVRRLGPASPPGVPFCAGRLAHAVRRPTGW